ncbi:glucosamine-6-phosphate deaminase [Corynebacterium uberis]|uniref:glucosamine-6-phosphate deaminase n=1 Tax=Corynebacterium TaxID=1716 RepID=UPI001D0AB3D3|nr:MULTISPECIES: glucosamine-6-phosphate deaminase [Corynebacterium]MCZ9309803.1 glucosamine-6-phosphate deaminase [Corynebacterium sp. c6VSa_13]UDL73601.1 glucosamine-6-phosphate deaminase [Corynebacterium uberis]UDL75519.1 glucosamine-6-phosphate deaminase [Corynebacterium uberis]UDL77732.1 glucosamine-6-phosphate deaminase [Corynebacterium uberis]UDL80016.1 glucosamine-6-phosphate deaminase [Corynebacterium uberis]
MEILIRDTPEQVAVQAADILAGYVREGATIGVATGSTPLHTYRELIRRHREEGLSFAQTQMFALDEYVGLPYEHEQSYHRVIHDELTSRIDVHPANVHVPDGLAADLIQATADYERDIEAAGGIDIQILGVGTNGHIGFNEPGSSLNSLTRIKTLHPQTVADNARFFDSPDDVPYQVLTQGLGTIQRARHLLLLATGEAKADAVARLVEGPLSAACPASILQWHRHATVLVDAPAAAGLRSADYYRFVEEHKPAWQRY